MNPGACSQSLRSGIRAAIAAMLLMLLSFAGLAAGHTETHEWLHTDQSASDHFCFVTLLQQGHGDAAPTTIAIAPALISAAEPIAFADSQISSEDLDLPEARGPPALP